MTKLVYMLIVIILAITVSLSCPYLHNPAVAAQVHCANGYTDACAWLADAIDTDNTCHSSNTCLPTKTTNNPFAQ